MGYVEFSYKVLKGFVRKISGKFKGIDILIRKSKIGYSLEEYLASMFFTAFLIFIFGVPSFSIAIYLAIKNLPYAIAGGIIFTSVISSITLLLFYMYPSMKFGSQKKAIDNNIHYAAIYMSTIAGSGTSIYTMFKLLASFKELGEISKICNDIVRDIEIFGYNIAEAIAREANRCPSDKFKELLWGIRSTILTGGDIKEYLDEKAKEYMSDYRRRLEEFINSLSVFTEVYITLVIVGVVFALVLTTIMTMVGIGAGQIKTIQVLMIVVGLPLITAMYVVFLKSISPLS